MEFIIIILASLFIFSSDNDFTIVSENDNEASNQVLNRHLPQSSDVSSWEHLDDGFWPVPNFQRPSQAVVSNDLTKTPPFVEPKITTNETEVGSKLKPECHYMFRDLTLSYGQRRYYQKGCQHD